MAALPSNLDALCIQWQKEMEDDDFDSHMREAVAWKEPVKALSKARRVIEQQTAAPSTAI